MATTEAGLPPANQQGLDIRSTPREEMRLYPLDTFPYDYAGREIRIRFELPEFTCVCPFSDFPDFATFRIEYVPGERCVELKSLKLYLWSFRNDGIFYERAVNRILDDLVAACAPRWMQVVGDFNVRGGIKSVVTARHGRRPDDGG